MWRVMCLVVFRLFMPKNFRFLLRIILGFVLFFVMFKYSYFFSSMLLKTSVFKMDSLAYYFIFLTLLLFMFVIILEIQIGLKLFFFLKILLLVVLVMFFSSVQALYFYVFFEASFIFMFMIIMMWGYKPERIEALKYFMIYSLVGSLPLLRSIVIGRDSLRGMGFLSWGWTHFVRESITHLDKICLDYRVDELKEGFFRWDGDGTNLVNLFYGFSIPHFFWILVFLFKFPVFGLHLWLPKAHVESPVYGSMLLAGIMIKLGVIGIFRLNYRGIFFYYSWSMVNNFFFYFRVGLIVIKLICRRQFDLKSYVAYSSIVHMSLIVIRIWAGSYMVLVGAVMMRFAHGLCSSALFLNFKNFYLIRKTRKIFLNRGYMYLFSRFCFLWFLLCILNCSVPLSLSFFSEIILIFSGVSFKIVRVLVFLLKVFICGCYCILLYLSVSHGKRKIGLRSNSFSVWIYIKMLLLWYHFFIVYFYVFGI